MRTLLGVVVGLVSGYIVVIVFELTNSILFLQQGAINPMDMSPEQMAELVANMPAASFGVLVLGWFAGAFVGSWVAGRVARTGKRTAGYLVAALLLLATAINFVSFTHPLWVMIAGPILVLLGGFYGSKAGAKV